MQQVCLGLVRCQRHYDTTAEGTNKAKLDNITSPHAKSAKIWYAEGEGASEHGFCSNSPAPGSREASACAEPEQHQT
jgi:hypothetical protein